MKGIFISIVAIVTLTSLVLASGIIVKTTNPNFMEESQFYRSLGDEMAKRGEIAKSITTYEHFLSIEESVEVRNNLAVLYHQEQRYSEAIDHLRMLVTLEPENPSRHYDLAVNLVDKFRNTDEKIVSDLEEALGEFRTAELLSPGFENARNNAQVLEEVLSN